MQLAHMLFLSVRFTLYSYRSLQLLHWTVNVREQVTPVSSGGPSDGQMGVSAARTIEADRWGRLGEFLIYLFLFLLPNSFDLLWSVCIDIALRICIDDAPFEWLYVTRFNLNNNKKSSCQDKAP